MFDFLSNLNFITFNLRRSKMIYKISSNCITMTIYQNCQSYERNVPLLGLSSWRIKFNRFSEASLNFSNSLH